MSKVRVAGFTISLDGYGAGPRQTREEPLGNRDRVPQIRRRLFEREGQRDGRPREADEELGLEPAGDAMEGSVGGCTTVTGLVTECTSPPSSVTLSCTL